jgi:hypothetical protein
MNAIDCHPSKHVEIATAIGAGHQLRRLTTGHLIEVTKDDVRQLVWNGECWSWVTAPRLS